MLEQSKTTKEIDEAILALQSKVPIIKKGTANDYYRSKYAEYPDIQTAIRPHLIEAKLLVKFFPVEGNKIIFILTHLTSQEFYKATIDLNSVSASPQAQGSAISYMKRYAVVAAFDLIIEGDDDDGNAGSGKKTEQAPTAQKQTAQPKLKPLTPSDTKEWNYQILAVQNKKHTLEDVVKSFAVTDIDKELLLKAIKKGKPVLKPGSVEWNKSVEWLANPQNKLSTIEWKYTISEKDLIDLQDDVLNYTPATDEATNKAK